jgi:hypothetical protein
MTLALKAISLQPGSMSPSPSVTSATNVTQHWRDTFMPKRKMSIGPRAKFARRKWLKPTFPNLGLFAGYEDPRRDEFIFGGEANSVPTRIVDIDGAPYGAPPVRKREVADRSQGRKEGADDEEDVGQSDDDEIGNDMPRSGARGRRGHSALPSSHDEVRLTSGKRWVDLNLGVFVAYGHNHLRTILDSGTFAGAPVHLRLDVTSFPADEDGPVRVVGNDVTLISEGSSRAMPERPVTRPAGKLPLRKRRRKQKLKFHPRFSLFYA